MTSFIFKEIIIYSYIYLVLELLCFILLKTLQVFTSFNQLVLKTTIS